MTMLTTAMAALSVAAPAVAQQDRPIGPLLASETGVRHFDIPAQPLVTAINAFGRQSGLQVTAEAEVTAGVQARAVSGDYTPVELLSRLLAGTGVTWRMAGNNIVVLAKAPPTSGSAIQLAPVRVTASDDRGDGTPVALGGNLHGPSDEPVANRVNPQTTVGSKYPVSQRDLPQTVTLVTQDQISAQNLNTVADAIARSPGVTVINSLPTPFRGDLAYSRGWQITNYNVDGIPTTIDTVIPQQNSAMYDRVEVLHGAAGLYGGLGGAGGTINVVHKQPQKDPALNAALGAGTNDSYNAMLDISQRLDQSGTLRARGVVARQRIGHDNGTFDKGTSVYGIIEADVSPQTTIEIGGSYEADSGRPDSGFPNYPDGKLNRPSRSHSAFYAPWFHYENNMATAFGNISHRFGNGWSIKFAATYQATNAINHNAWAASTVDPSTNSFLAWAAYTPWNRKEQAYDLYTDGPFSLFGRDHRLTIGANYYKSRLYQEFNEPWDIFTTSFETAQNLPGYNWASTGGGVYGDYQTVHTENYGVYANLRLSLADSLTLIAGGRLAWYKNATSDIYNFNGDFSSTASRYRYEGKTTPFAGLVYEINDIYSAYFSYSTIFLPRYVTDKQGDVMKPLQGDQYEFGVKGTYLNGRLNASLAAFRGTQKNRIVQDPTDRNYYIPAGSARVQGFEALISGSPMDGLTLSGGYTYLKTKIFDDNATGSQFAQYTPDHMFKLWFDYRLPGDLKKWSVGGGTTVASSTGFQLYHQPGYIVFDGSVAYKLNHNLQLSFIVKNILNRYYYDYVGLGYNHLGQGRNIMATLRAAY